MSSPDCKRQKLADDLNSVVKMSNVSPTKDSYTQTENVTISESASNKIPKFNMNYQWFEQVAMTSAFVDRTLLIEELLHPGELPEEESTYVMMFAPSKFGKTINLNMIRLFCDIEDKDTKTKEDITKNPTMQELRKNPSKNMKVFLRQFKGTQYKECCILKQEKFFIQHFGRHAVILFDFRECRAKNESKAIVFCALQVRKCYLENKYLENSKEFQSDDKEHVILKQTCVEWLNYSRDELESLFVNDVIDGLKNLVKSLRLHWGTKPVFLVDEIDKPVVAALEAKISEDEVRAVGTAITDVVCSILKPGHEQLLELQAALLTGICKFSNSGMSPLDNTVPVYFLSDDRFSKYYGLTAQEVEDLVKKFYRSQGDAKVEKIIKDIEVRYNGYCQYSPSGEKKECARYCLFSVLKYIININKDTNDLYFWSDGGFLTGKLVPILEKSEVIMSAIHTLLCDKSGTIEIDFQRAVNAEDLLGLYRKEMDPDSEEIFNFFLQRGYLAHNLEPKKEENKNESEKKMETKINVKIPNLEIKKIYLDMFEDYHQPIKSKFISCGQIFKSLPTLNDTDEFQTSLNKLCEDLECVLRAMQCKSEASICCHILAILKLYADYQESEMEYTVQYIDSDNKSCRIHIDVWGRNKDFALIFKVEFNSAASGKRGKIGSKAKSSLAAAEDIVDKINPENRSSNKAGTGRDLNKLLKSFDITDYVLIGLAVDGDYTTHMLVFRNTDDWKKVIQVNPEKHFAELISTHLKSK